MLNTQPFLILTAQTGETLLVRQRDAWDAAMTASIVVMGLTALLLLVLLAVVLVQIRRAARGLDRLKDRVGADPGVERLRKVAENLDYITHSLRGDVDRMSRSVTRISERLDQASHRMEERIEDFNALMEVVQGEAEAVFIDTASTVRGVREGTRSLGKEGGAPDGRPAAAGSPELDPRDG